MAKYDELLDDAEDSAAFDADLTPVGFEPEQLDDKDSGLVVEEPKIIHIGRKLKKDEAQKMSDMPGQ